MGGGREFQSDAHLYSTDFWAKAEVYLGTVRTGAVNLRVLMGRKSICDYILFLNPSEYH